MFSESVNEASTSSTDVHEGRDMAWECAEYDNRKLRRIKCKWCSHIMSGGINRFKNHILQIKGKVKSCPKATPEMMKKINDKKKEKIEKQANRKRIDRIYNEDMSIILEESDDEVVAVESMETKKKKLKMSDVREITKDAEYIHKLRNEVIAKVGIENIIQFISDNGSNFKAAGKALMKEHPTLFWTPCAAHYINLVMKDLSEQIPRIIKSLGRAKSLFSYIYNHGAVLTMFRELTNNSELHRSTNTQFATQYYTLSSLLEYIHDLQVLFVQEKWMKSKYARTSDGHRQMATVSSNEFWENVTFSCQVLGPLVEVVRMADTERKPFMGYVYEVVSRCKERTEENLKRV
ncbi:uncharacterized protein LOC113333871 [Papaver somniferum]|uniref:uncharacterized protein LOC113333871 n=1 Tax=Papaver somniferum TaxID=3469 RepID=UPI000E6F6EDD|nr:uncharacterized protein LOC113333871 [Papaver somniferum]